MSIAQLQLAPGADISAAQELPRHSQLLTRPVQGLPVRYRTGYPVEVWPIRIADARLEAAERSAFAVTQDDTIATLQDDDLRPALNVIFAVLSRHLWGESLPDGFSFEFESSWC